MLSKAKKRGFVSGAMTLAAAGFAAKMLGAVYRIPLTNILGAEGIGLYQLVFPVYALMLTLSSGAIPTVISRMVSERAAVDDVKGANDVLFTSAIMLAMTGGAAMAVMYMLSAPLAGLQGDASIRLGYYAVAPSVLLVAGSSFFKGWFQGNLNMFPSAVAQIVEQVVKMGAGLFLAWYFSRWGVIYAVVGALIGLTVSELASFLLMAAMYVKSGMELERSAEYRFAESGGNIMRVALPIAVSGLIFPLTQFVDSLLIVNVLRWRGEGDAVSTALYGLLTGPVNSLVNMPVVITIALAVAVVPAVSMNRAKRNADGVKNKCRTAVKLSYAVGVPSFFGIFVLADDIMRILYPALSANDRTTAALLLRISSVSIILLSQIQIYTAMLQAMDKTGVGVRNLAIAAVVKIAADVVLIRYISISGASVASVLSYLIAALLGAAYMRKYLGKDDALLASVAKTLAAGGIMAVFVRLADTVISNIYVSFIVSVIIGVAIYVLFMLIFKVLQDEELESLPFGSKIAALGGKLRFWERKK